MCQSNVFFYKSEHGGRVFFDDVGWPWPKHPCTDSKLLDHGKAVYAASRSASGGKTNWTREYTFFTLVSVYREGNTVHLKLKETAKHIFDLIRALLSKVEHIYTLSMDDLKRFDIHEVDLRAAPSFLIKKAEVGFDRPIIEFICARKGEIRKVQVSHLHGHR